MSSVLCITGMHRSGTSLTASWLEQCGLKIEDGRLVGGATGNERGHFEDHDFVDFHSRVILANNPKSRGWIVTQSPAPEFSDEDRSSCKALAERRDVKYPTWGWKDPRSVLFLEQWKAVIPQLKTLLLWRSCHEVVLSLRERALRSKHDVLRIDSWRAIKTWEYYNRRVIAYKKKHPDQAVLVPLQRLLGAGSAVLGLINRRFELSLQEVPIDAVWDPGALRSRATPTLLSLLCRIRGIKSIEQSLGELSDL